MMTICSWPTQTKHISILIRPSTEYGMATSKGFTSSSSPQPAVGMLYSAHSRHLQGHVPPAHCRAQLITINDSIQLRCR